MAMMVGLSKWETEIYVLLYEIQVQAKYWLDLVVTKSAAMWEVFFVVDKWAEKDQNLDLAL